MSTTYLWRVTKIVFIVAFTILFVRSFVIEPGKVDGISMEPNFIDSDFFLVNKFSLLLTSPKRGDVLQVYVPAFDEVVIKRAIGLPGETVTIKQNKVFITGADGVTLPLDEPYLKPYTVTDSADGTATSYGPLGSSEYFVLGDNRPNSTDSRVYGIIQRSTILGRVLTEIPFMSH